MKRLGPVLALLVSLGATRSFAQEAPEPGDRVTSFQAVEGASREQVSGFNLMVGAYGIVWLVTTGFLYRLGRMQAKSTADVARLESALREETPKA